METGNSKFQVKQEQLLCEWVSVSMSQKPPASVKGSEANQKPSAPPNNDGLTCPICDQKGFKRQSGLTLHINMLHINGQDTLFCPKCNKVFTPTPGSTAAERLNKHKKTCGLKRTYPCRECKTPFTDKRAHRSHESKCVTPKCTKCGQVYSCFGETSVPQIRAESP